MPQYLSTIDFLSEKVRSVYTVEKHLTLEAHFNFVGTQILGKDVEPLIISVATYEEIDGEYRTVLWTIRVCNTLRLNLPLPPRFLLLFRPHLLPNLSFLVLSLPLLQLVFTLITVLNDRNHRHPRHPRHHRHHRYHCPHRHHTDSKLTGNVLHDHPH